jgi:hypothetical protein
MFIYNDFDSSNIKQIKYTDNIEFVDAPDEADFGVLEITFLNNTVYEYYNVPWELYQEMVQSKSKGTFLNKEIKDKYEFAKIK